jgi:plastocyanin
MTVTIRALEAQMKYDVAAFDAPPGAKIRLRLENRDGMPHNLVVCDAGDDRGFEVAQAAWALGDEGIAKSWIPAHPRVLAATKMIQPRESDEITFTLPETPGTYPYVCTFPGHAQLMNGVIRVRGDGPLPVDLRFDHYEGQWSNLPDFTKLTPSFSGPAPNNKMDIVRDARVAGKQNFGLVYTGTLEIAKEGEYQFFLTSDDGSRLLVDDQVVVAYDGIHPAGAIKNGKVRLKPGPHRLRVEYFEASGEEALYVGWKGPGFNESALTTWMPNDRQPGGPEHNKGGDIVLAPAGGEAVMHRNFIEGASPRGIAVGYPGGINALWDANTFTLVQFWRGAFLDVKKHWSDRGGGAIPPLGYDARHPAPGPALARLTTPDATWPTASKRDAEARYLGHQLDSRRFPTFRWRHAALGVAVEEFYRPEGHFAPGGGARLTRELSLAATGQPPNDLYLRAAVGQNIEPAAEGWVVDGQYRVRGAGLVLRASAGKSELVLPLSFPGGRAHAAVTYSWLD